MEFELDQTHIVSVLKVFPFKGQSFVDWDGFEAETEIEMKSQLNRESCGNIERKRTKVTCVERDSEKVYLVQYASVRFDMYDLTGRDILTPKVRSQSVMFGYHLNTHPTSDSRNIAREPISAHPFKSL